MINKNQEIRNRNKRIILLVLTICMFMVKMYQHSVQTVPYPSFIYGAELRELGEGL